MTAETPSNAAGSPKARTPHPLVGAIWRGRGRPWLRPKALLSLAWFSFLGYLCYQAALWTASWGGVISLIGLMLLAGAGLLYWRAAWSGWRFLAHLGLRGVLIVFGLPALLLFALSIVTVGTGLGPRAWLMVGGIMFQQASDVVRPVGVGLTNAPDDIALAFTGRSFSDWLTAPEEAAQVNAVVPRPPAPSLEATASISATAPATILQIGGIARVVTSDGSSLRVRQEPGTTSQIVARLSAGATVEITGGPTPADGYIWWRVRGDWGEGWCAAEFLVPTGPP